MEWLVYEGKAALALAAFWLCWRLLLQRDTFHRLNRAVLLATAVAAQVFPLCVVTIDKTVEVLPMEPVPTVSASFTKGYLRASTGRIFLPPYRNIYRTN